MKKQLPTDDMADLFIAEFGRDVAKLTSTRDERESRQRARLTELDIKIENLAANMLVGVISPTIARMLGEREIERASLAPGNR